MSETLPCCPSARMIQWSARGGQALDKMVTEALVVVFPEDVQHEAIIYLHKGANPADANCIGMNMIVIRILLMNCLDWYLTFARLFCKAMARLVLFAFFWPMGGGL